MMASASNARVLMLASGASWQGSDNREGALGVRGVGLSQRPMKDYRNMTPATISQRCKEVHVGSQAQAGRAASLHAVSFCRTEGMMFPHPLHPTSSIAGVLMYSSGRVSRWTVGLLVAVVPGSSGAAVAVAVAGEVCRVTNLWCGSCLAGL
jgi:hypothetical protein